MINYKFCCDRVYAPVAQPGDSKSRANSATASYCFKKAVANAAGASCRSGVRIVSCQKPDASYQLNSGNRKLRTATDTKVSPGALLTLSHINEGLRILTRSFRVRAKGIKRYKGNEEEICRQILDDCWNGRYIQTSAGHFNAFYIRDFAFFADAHTRLGYKGRVLKTLEYALDKFSKQKLATTLTPKGKAIDIFRYSPDSLALLIYSLRIARANHLIKKHRNFLNREIRRFYDLVLDKEKGIVKTGQEFSSIKDNALRSSSMYNNCMLWLLADELKRIKILENPFDADGIKKSVKKHFWTGRYFLDDLSGRRHVSGDANTFPFWTGMFKDKKMFYSCLKKMQKEKLDYPFPLKYTSKPVLKIQNRIIEILNPNYEGDTLWIHLGLCFMEAVKKHNKKLLKKYLDSYASNIRRHRNFLELYNADRTPFKTAFYYSDESMSWCAKYLELSKLL